MNYDRIKDMKLLIENGFIEQGLFYADYNFTNDKITEEEFEMLYALAMPEVEVEVEQIEEVE